MQTKFQERFKQLKQEAGLSDLKLSQLLGVAPMTICRWENGIHDIKSNDLMSKFA